MRHMTYNSTIRNYKDERSHEGKEILQGEQGFGNDGFMAAVSILAATKDR